MKQRGEVNGVRSCRWGAVSIFLFASVVGIWTSAQCCTVFLQRGQSLQAAVDRAPEGASICLAAGEWQEHITIEKSVTLRGAGADETVIRGTLRDVPVVWIRSPGQTKVVVRVEGLCVAGGTGSGGAGIRIEGNVEVTTTACTLTENDHAIIMSGRTRATVDSCLVAGGMYGIEIKDDAHLTITDSTVAGNTRNGMVARHSSHVVITSCSISRNRWFGIALSGSAQATVHDSALMGNLERGIALSDAAQAMVTGCTVTGNLWGISVRDDAQATIISSSISGNRLHGVELRDRADVRLEGNAIHGNREYGVVFVSRPCFDAQGTFGGRVSGKDNSGEGNGVADFCPHDLLFLFTPEGGELDARSSTAGSGPSDGHSDVGVAV